MRSVAGLARRLRSAFYLALAPPFSVPDIRVGRTGNLWRLQHRVTTNPKGFYALVYMNFLRFGDKRRASGASVQRLSSREIVAAA